VTVRPTVIASRGVPIIAAGRNRVRSLLMTVADVALYVRDTWKRSASVPLAVTTSLTINFLRKPGARKAHRSVCRLMKVGRALVVGEVAL